MDRPSVVATALMLSVCLGGTWGRVADARAEARHGPTLGAPQAVPAISPVPGRAKAKDFYVLGLGDSVPFAFSFAQFLADHSDPDVNFGNGFVDRVTEAIRAQFPQWQVTRANFSCPGETTTSMMDGPCAYAASTHFPLHDEYTGAQLDAAEAFLDAHRGPGLILLNIGSNDPGDFAADCLALPDPNPCLLETYPRVAPQVRASIRAHVSTILARLHRRAPRALIYVWNTYGLDDTDPQTVTLLKDVNRAIREAVAQRHARAKLLNATAVVKPSMLCALTFWCTTGFDSHLTAAGHEAYAAVILKALRRTWH